MVSCKLLDNIYCIYHKCTSQFPENVHMIKRAHFCCASCKQH